MSLRKAKVEDAPGIAKVHADTWRSHYRGQVADEYLDQITVEKRVKNWTQLLSDPKPRSCIFVSEEGSAVTGFCAVGASRDEDAPADTGELYSIYVDASSQGKGAGSELMKTGLDFLKDEGFRRVTLWVLKTNAKTIDFYESKGWKFDGTEKIDRNDMRVFEEIRYGISLE